jgi:glyoxylase I family protein
VPLVGVDHIALTVADLDRSTEWYCRHLGFEPMIRYTNGEIDAQVQVLQHADLGARLSLRRFAFGETAPFSEFRIGLDHFALRVRDEAELDEWRARLQRAGVPCSRTDLPELSILAFRDPDNIQIELCTALTEARSGAP